MKALLDRPVMLVDLPGAAPDELRVLVPAPGGGQQELARYMLVGPGLPGEVNYRYAGTVPATKEGGSNGHR